MVHTATDRQTDRQRDRQTEQKTNKQEKEKGIKGRRSKLARS